MEEQNREERYNAFRRYWINQHRGSVPKERDATWAGIGIALGIVLWLIILIATSVLSGAHSIPTVSDTIPASTVVPDESRDSVATLGFVMLELTIFASAMFKTTSKYAKWALFLSLLGALLANENSSWKAVTLREQGEAAATILEIVVALVVGASAPLTAYLSGEMVGQLSRWFETERRKIQDEYKTAYKQMEASIKSAFTDHEKQSRPKTATTVATKTQFTKAEQALAAKIAEEGTADVPITKLMEMYGVNGRGTVANARKLAKDLERSKQEEEQDDSNTQRVGAANDMEHASGS